MPDRQFHLPEIGSSAGRTTISVGYLHRRVGWLAGLVSGIAALTLPARHWWIADLIANLRVQLILGLLATGVLLLCLRHWRTLLLVVAVTFWQGLALRSAFETGTASVVPSIPSADSTDRKPPQHLRIFMANVLTRNPHHDQITAQIRAADPDVIAILELGSTLEELLQREFGGTHKHCVSESQDDGNFGIGLWSRLPLDGAHVFHLNAPILPSIEANIAMPSRRIHLDLTHPLPPFGARNFNHRNQHLNLLAERIRTRQEVEPKRAVILLGDLNLTPWSPCFDDLLTSSGLKSAAAGHGLRPTWYRWPAFPFGLILDHGLYSNHLTCDERAVLPSNGSDHRAVVFSFSTN